MLLLQASPQTEGYNNPFAQLGQYCLEHFLHGLITDRLIINTASFNII
jgi:hypothetical protein